MKRSAKTKWLASVRRGQHLLLGGDPKQRLRLARSLSAAVVFLLCMLIQYFAVVFGMADRMHALLMVAFVLCAECGFYVAIRSGWTLRWRDPALTMPQMIFAIVCAALAYAINPPLRGLMPMVMALVLVFGAFILPPQRCRQLGWLAVLALVTTMMLSMARHPADFPLRIEAFHFLLSALVLPVIGRLAGQLSDLRFRQKVQQRALRDALEALRKLATHDELTGLPNRRRALEIMDYEERRTRRQRAPLCTCLIDIDHFKQVNDRLGHLAGDQALQHFAAILGKALRAGDVLARWGGEEFLLLLPATQVGDALPVIERLRQLCADPENWREHPELKVTFSAGLTAQEYGESIDLAIARADVALYEAKKAGRNCVQTA